VSAHRGSQGTGLGNIALPATRASLLDEARERLARAGVSAPAPEAEQLLLHALAIPRTRLWTDRSAQVPEEHVARFARLLEARCRRVPLQLLIGEVSFHAAELEVEPGVFIPRPETERLVEIVLELLDAGGEGPAEGTIVDLGTGTGAIPIALLLSLPEGWTAVALDRSEKAIALATRNARRNGVDGRLDLHVADFRDPPLQGFRCPADVVVSNLPYIPTGLIPSLMPEVRDHDPREALDGGPEGLDAFCAVAGGIEAWLKPGGLIALEIGHDQADSCMEHFGPHLAGARVSRDLAGMPRVLTGRRRGTR
jgi:release factor glutamine methyltransferase